MLWLSYVRQRARARGKHFGAHFGLCLLRRLPFLADPGTGFPIKNYLPTLGKRSTNCVAHAKQEKNSDLQDRVQWGFVFVTPNYFFRFMGVASGGYKTL